MFPLQTRRLFDLRASFAKLAAFAPGDDDEGGDGAGEGGGDEGSSGTGGDDEGGDAGASGADDKKPVKDPEKKRLSDEAAKHRNAAKAEKKRADEAEAALRAIEDADKPKLELAERTAKEATARAERAEGLVQTMGLELSFFKSKAASKFKDPADALLLLKPALKDLKPDEETGEYDSDELLAAADDLIKRKPFYAAENSEDDDDEGELPPSGKPNNNGKLKPSKDASRQQLVKKFPALANR